MRTRRDATTIFKEIVASIPQQQQAKGALFDRAWRWAEGVHVFPEAICPFCNVVMRSGCLWLINEREQRLMRIVALVEGRLKAVAINHPHVYAGPGTVCMGSSRMGGVAQAVLMGMNPNDALGGFGPNRSCVAWTNFFAAYFNDHVHTERKKRRPTLMRVRKAPAKLMT